MTHSDFYEVATLLVADEVHEAKRSGYMLGSDGKMHMTAAEALRRLAASRSTPDDQETPDVPTEQ